MYFGFWIYFYLNFNTFKQSQKRAFFKAWKKVNLQLDVKHCIGLNMDSLWTNDLFRSIFNTFITIAILIQQNLSKFISNLCFNMETINYSKLFCYYLMFLLKIIIKNVIFYLINRSQYFMKICFKFFNFFKSNFLNNKNIFNRISFMFINVLVLFSNQVECYSNRTYFIFY